MGKEKQDFETLNKSLVAFEGLEASREVRHYEGEAAGSYERLLNREVAEALAKSKDQVLTEFQQAMSQQLLDQRRREKHKAEARSLYEAVEAAAKGAQESKTGESPIALALRKEEMQKKLKALDDYVMPFVKAHQDPKILKMISPKDKPAVDDLIKTLTNRLREARQLVEAADV